MSRSSRQWNDYRAHIKLLEGDLNECHKWYGVALIRLQFLLAHRPGSVTDVMVPVDGIYIRVDTKPNRIHIIAANPTLYLETGFLDLKLNAGIENIARRPTLHFNTYLTSYAANNPEALLGKAGLKGTLITAPYAGEGLVDGQVSESIRCNEPVMQFTYESTTYMNGPYCDYYIMLAAKTTRAYMPPSLFPGKLKLCIQALYGVKMRPDISAAAPAYYLAWKQINLSPRFSGGNNCILFTTPDFRYFLVEIMSGSYSYVELELTAAAREWATVLSTHTLVGNRTLSDKVEAYILAYSTPKAGDTKVTVTGSPTIVGDPIFYGWQANWDGSEATLVTHEPYEISTNVMAYRSRTYTALITWNPTTQAVAVSVSNVDNGHWNPNNSGWNVWYPDLTLGGMEAMMFAIEVGKTAWSGNYDLPIYAYYGHDDALKLVKPKVNLTSKASSLIEYADKANYPRYAGGMTEFKWTTSNSSYYGAISCSVGESNFTIDFEGWTIKTSQRININSLSGSFGQVASDVITAPAFVPNFEVVNGQKSYEWLVSNGYFYMSSPTVCTSQRDAYGRLKYEMSVSKGQFIRQYDVQTTTGNPRKSGSGFIEFLWNSCNSVVVGERNKTTQTGHNISTSGALTANIAAFVNVFVRNYRPWPDNTWTSVTYLTSSPVMILSSTLPADISSYYEVPFSGTSSSSTDPNAATEKSSLVVDDLDSVEIATIAANTVYAGAYYYVDWVNESPPGVRSDYDDLKTSINKYYDLTHHSGTLNNEFPEDIAVGWI